MTRLMLLLTAGVVLSSGMTPVLPAHPGHEYKVTGVVSKVRVQQLEVQQFDITDREGAKTTFFVNAATEVLIGRARGSLSDLKNGVTAAVDGVENDKGMIEAKVVRIQPAQQ